MMKTNQVCLVVVAVLALAMTAHSMPFDIKEGIARQRWRLPRPADLDPSAPTPDIIKYYGYPVEVHNVSCADGFELTMHRIPHGKTASNSTGPQKVVILQHGLLDSSATWVMQGPGFALGFILADKGYDVWLGNNRGNTYSMGNSKYAPNSDQFWDFSWDDMAHIDMPTEVDYVLKTTGAATLSWVGHSQGTVQAFAALSAGDATPLSKQIDKFIALAPVAYVGSITSLFLKQLSLILPLGIIPDIFGDKAFLPDTKLLEKVMPFLCQDWGAVWCSNLLFLIMGFDEGNLNSTLIPRYLGHVPAGTSVKNFIHWAQGVKGGKFQMFDYGDDNPSHYNGSSTPPQYPLDKITVPVALFSGGHDDLADPQDVGLLEAQLPPGYYQNYQSAYEHMDFVWGENAHTDIYPLVLEQLPAP